MPSIGSTGTPSICCGSFSVTGTSIEGQSLGLLFYGTSGAIAQPFQGGTLCVQPPLVRLPAQGSGGASGNCSGSYATAVQGVLSAVGPGGSAWAQYWFRDPGAASGTGLSDALTFVVCP